MPSRSHGSANLRHRRTFHPEHRLCRQGIMNGVVIGTMTKHHVKYLLIGGGVASSAAAEAIRQRDAEGEVLLITQESTRPYSRPPLSKEALRNRQPRAAFFTKSPGWYTEHGVELRTGRRAAHLDTARQAV